MTQLKSQSGTNLISLQKVQQNILSTPVQFSEYTIIVIKEGEGIFYSDFGTFPFKGPMMLFATPLQLIYIKEINAIQYDILQFHGDFYCIEYHREEVACNGLLFNNVYIEPSLKLELIDQAIFANLNDQITEELSNPAPSDIVLKSLLQLFLAKSSQIKIRELEKNTDSQIRDDEMERFKNLLDNNFLTLHKPSDYADLLRMSTNNLTKRCSKYFKKTPSQLITERIMLEAKKQLHLTRKSIKEIAFALNFKDEFYFSRVFKKFTNESPQSFRDKTGISIVADLYR
ncbi:AraC family transcriptional regulator [Flavobacterium sp. Root186]|uniref:helix-turn-helix domain-containing protein n=1 Tax=Flavobacterium sp. Root186 TaxID=1736485 RepID=UPI0006FAF472|nr:response regulator transcription factor [Flavobacterium sp. Root186]KRB55586.1 AraC family transcriptional regulator [Flavobacterium sp. Root186]